jgi:putative transposase
MLTGGGYRIRNKSQQHFLTLTVVEWVDVFTRKLYREILMDSLQHCQKQKDLLIHSYCLMSNHVHLILSAKNDNLSDILRDFKTFTSKRIIRSIENNGGEPRKDWMLQVFRKNGGCNQRNPSYQFWIQDNHPEELYAPTFTLQKLNYIHMNPVRAGIVEKPEDYLFSSAWNYRFREQRGKLEISFV